MRILQSLYRYYFDYTHGPYLILCEVPDHDCHNGAGCEHFIEGIIRQIKEGINNEDNKQ